MAVNEMVGKWGERKLRQNALAAFAGGSSRSLEVKAALSLSRSASCCTFALSGASGGAKRKAVLGFPIFVTSCANPAGVIHFRYLKGPDLLTSI